MVSSKWYMILLFLPFIIAMIIPENLNNNCIANNNWNDSSLNNSLEDNPLPVYNSASVSKSITNNELLNLGMDVIKDYPFEEMLWRPNIVLTTCFFYFYIGTMVQQVLPAIFIDTLASFVKKPILPR